MRERELPAETNKRQNKLNGELNENRTKTTQGNRQTNKTKQTKQNRK